QRLLALIHFFLGEPRKIHALLLYHQAFVQDESDQGVNIQRYRQQNQQQLLLHRRLALCGFQGALGAARKLRSFRFWDERIFAVHSFLPSCVWLTAHCSVASFCAKHAMSSRASWCLLRWLISVVEFLSIRVTALSSLLKPIWLSLMLLAITMSRFLRSCLSLS